MIGSLRMTSMRRSPFPVVAAPEQNPRKQSSCGVHPQQRDGAPRLFAPCSSTRNIVTPNRSQEDTNRLDPSISPYSSVLRENPY